MAIAYVACISLKRFLEDRDLSMLDAVPGTSIDKKCAICGTEVVLAPSSQKLLASGIAGAAICYECAESHGSTSQAGAVMTEDGLREYEAMERHVAITGNSRDRTN